MAAGCRHVQHLAGLQAIRILQLWIAVCEAGPRSAFAEIRQSQRPQGIAAADYYGICGWYPSRSLIRREHQHRARLQERRIDDARIGSEKFAPARAAAKPAARQPPQGISGLNQQGLTSAGLFDRRRDRRNVRAEYRRSGRNGRRDVWRGCCGDGRLRAERCGQFENRRNRRTGRWYFTS